MISLDYYCVALTDGEGDLCKVLYTSEETASKVFKILDKRKRTDGLHWYTCKYTSNIGGVPSFATTRERKLILEALGEK